MKRCTLALAIAIPVAALAQPKVDAADPKTQVPAVRYESAFAGYRSFKDEKPAPWKQVNEEVKGMGGHAAHGAAKPDAPKAPAAKPAEHKH